MGVTVITGISQVKVSLPGWIIIYSGREMEKHCIHPFSIENKNAFHHEVHHFCFQCRIGKCLQWASTVTHSHWGKWLGAFT